MTVYLILKIGILIFLIWIGFKMGTLVLSIDFELRWGMLDRVGQDVEKYKSNLLSVHDNLPWMLQVFEERNIAATWATVGALGCDNWDEFDRVRPKHKPSYKNEALDYVNDFNQKLDPNGELYFAPKLIRDIIGTAKQELGTHTFGHIYGTEPDVTYEELKIDLLTVKEFFSKKFGVTPESLVFPRNQVIYENKLIQDDVIKTYRGNENVTYLSAENQKEKQFFNRVKILLDAINPYISHDYNKNDIVNGNVLSSSMFKIHLPELLRKAHLSKLKHNITRLKSDEIYHIWYHPHNLGRSPKKKDDFLRFFDFIGEKIATNKLDSENMGSILSKVSS